MILKVDPDVLSLNEKYLHNQKKTLIFLITSTVLPIKITRKKIFNCWNWKLTDGWYRTDQPWYERIDPDLDDPPWLRIVSLDSNLPISVLIDQKLTIFSFYLRTILISFHIFSLVHQRSD